MDRPTQEEFAQAPLFVPYAPQAPRDWIDYSASELVVEGYTLSRVDHADGFSFALEGVHVVECRPGVVDGEPAWLATFFDGASRAVGGIDARIAASEMAGVLHDLVRLRPDSLVFHMEQAGVPLGKDAIRVDYAAEDADEDEDLEDEAGEDAALVEMAAEEDRFGEPVRIVRRGFRAWVQGEEGDRAWGEVRDGFARAGEDGVPLCPASVPMLSQIEAIELADGRFGENAARHRADLKFLRALVGDPSAIMDIELRRGVHTFDLVGSDVRDAVVPQSAIEAFAQARRERIDQFLAGIPEGQDPTPEQFAETERALAALPDPTLPALNRVADRPLGEVMREATGFAAGEFREIRDMPTYQREQIRGVGREMMSPHIGDVPMERIVCGSPSRHDPEAYAAFMAFFAEGELVKAVEPMSHPTMPGYVTSAGEVRRRDGWDALVFSDAFGTYAYAWPTQVVALEAAPEEELEEAPALAP